MSKQLISTFAHQDAIDYAFAYHKLADTITFVPRDQRLAILDQTEQGVRENKQLNGRTAGAYLAAINFLREGQTSTYSRLHELVEVREHLD
jgi:hypothetical protein